ncbi:MAG: DUF1844 domain-containing protein [Desulfobacterales bacterium]|nr:DUF1844 domain-containing protein [Desulfobacterales bacterium]
MKDAPDDATGEPAAEPESQIPLPEMNFSTFVVSLNASALMHLGLMEDPVQGGKVKNLELGKQTIDILVMLEEKTRGNLSHEEEKLLQNVLYDLRINFVKQSK